MKNYPNYVIVNGERYDINTDYRYALKCFEVINNPDISDLERALAVIYILYGTIPNNAESQRELLTKASKYLRCGVDEETQKSRKKDMDFEQDSSYIYASFMSDYNIDLTKAKIHWWQYIDLIQGLTEKCVLSRVRELRNYDVSDIKDHKTKMKILEAKKNVELKETASQEEIEALDTFEKLLKGE